MKIDTQYIADTLNKLYSETKTFLNYSKDYELLFAIILSQQTTDIKVNQATSILFKKFSNLTDYNEENKDLIFNIIKPLGLAKGKTIHLIQTAEILLTKYNGKVPNNREDLLNMPGVGYKTSGVFLAEYYSHQYLPVDTHILRVSHRLNLVNNKFDATKTEIALEKLFKDYKLISLHRQLILFGRNVCHAINPECDSCPFNSFCKYKKQKN